MILITFIEGRGCSTVRDCLVNEVEFISIDSVKYEESAWTRVHDEYQHMACAFCFHSYLKTAQTTT